VSAPPLASVNPAAVDALETADKAMYEAKRGGGGVTLAEVT
jgi:hypothetical protein